MRLLPLPSLIHYELLLQVLERQTLPALEQKCPQYAQTQAIIIHLRKALACQKYLEDSCTAANIVVDHRWSLNHADSSQYGNHVAIVSDPPTAEAD